MLLLASLSGALFFRRFDEEKKALSPLSSLTDTRSSSRSLPLAHALSLLAMVSDAKKKRAALKAVGRKGSSKSLASGDGGADSENGSAVNLDQLVAQVGAASIDDGGDRSVTSVLTSHPQVKREEVVVERAGSGEWNESERR